jgi:hypothetical protein
MRDIVLWTRQYIPAVQSVNNYSKYIIHTSTALFLELKLRAHNQKEPITLAFCLPNQRD